MKLQPRAFAMCFALSIIASGQVATPNAGLVNQGLIPVPNWATSGANAASFDLSSFNPMTRILYFADRVNHGAMAIDTKLNAVVGHVLPPNCTGSCPSGVLVIPDLQKLVLTDRKTTLYIYDLDLPGSDPAVVTVPNGSDELDYDPIHHRFYVANTSAPYFLAGIDVAGPNANTVVASIPLPGSPEQPRFNPVDGMTYLTIPSVGVLRVDPEAGAAGTGAITATFPVADCGPAGNDIDPVTNTILLGCGTMSGQALMSLKDGAILARFPQATATDVMYFNPNLRRWYTGSGSNKNNGGNCPATNAGNVFPIVGVFAAPASATGVAQSAGAQCSGRNATALGVDPIQNNIYVATRQFPADPASADTGGPGILVFNDPARPQPSPARTQAVLGSIGAATFTLQGRTMNVAASLQGLSDAPTELVVTTTVGNEVVACGETGGQAICPGTLMGDPIVGGWVLVGNGPKLLAKGLITASK